MIINGIKLENYMSHEHTFVRFPENGVIALLGENGSGKSSLLDAIGVAVFNDYEGTLKERVRNGFDRAFVTVFLKNNKNEEMKIVRCWGSESHCELHIHRQSGKKEVYEGHREVYEALGREFGTKSRRTFQKLNRIRSHEILSPFELPKSTRTDYFEQLLGIEDYETAWKALRDPVTKLEERQRDLKKELSALRANYAKSEEIRDDMKVIEEVLLDLYSKVERLEALLEKSSKYEEHYQLIRNLLHRKNETIKKINSFSETSSSLKEKTGRAKDELERKKDNLRAYLDNKRRECPLCNQPITSEKDSKEVEEKLRKQVRASRKFVVSLENKMQEEKEIFNKSVEKLRELIKEINTLQNEAREFETPDPEKLEKALQEEKDEITRLTSKYDTLASVTEDSEDTKLAITDLAQEVEVVATAIRYLEDSREVIRKLGPMMSHQIRRKVAYEAGKWFSEISNKEAIIEWKDDYRYTVKFDSSGGEVTRISEGEKILSAIAIRISLSKIYSNIGFIILDEPTVNLDHERRYLFAKQISKDRAFEQIFIISHHEEMSEIFENSYHVTISHTSKYSQVQIR